MEIALGRYNGQPTEPIPADPGSRAGASGRSFMALEIVGSLNLPYDDTRTRIPEAGEAADSLGSGQSTVWQRSVQDFFIQSGYMPGPDEGRALIGTLLGSSLRGKIWPRPSRHGR